MPGFTRKQRDRTRERQLVSELLRQSATIRELQKCSRELLEILRMYEGVPASMQIATEQLATAHNDLQAIEGHCDIQRPSYRKPHVPLTDFTELWRSALAYPD